LCASGGQERKQSPGSLIHLSPKSILVRAFCSGFVMCRVLIVGKPNEAYSYAAVDQQTGEVPLIDRPACIGCTLPAGGQEKSKSARETWPRKRTGKHRYSANC
jgi:hypothetical protein